MKKNISLLVLFIILFAGCAAKTIPPVKAEYKNKFKGYTIAFSKESKFSQYHEELAHAVRRHFEYLHIPESLDELTIEFTIHTYDKGNQFLRWAVSFGAGEATSNIGVKFYNKDKKLIGQINSQAKLIGGLVGGDAENEMYDFYARQLAWDTFDNYIDKEYIENTNPIPPRNAAEAYVKKLKQK